MIVLALLLATVTGNPPPTSYACNGSTTVFTIPFPYLSASQVVATQTTSGVVTTVFGTVKPSIAPTSGTLTLPTACPNGATLTLTRVVPLTQPQGFRTGSYSGATHEQAFDRLEMQIQQNAATHATDKTAQATKDAAQDLAIAAAINPTPATVNSNSLITATGSTTSRTLAARAAEVANVRDFGATGNGSTDDSTAIQAAVTAVSATSGTVYLPAGSYVAKNITIASTISVQGASRDSVTFKLPALASLDGSPILNITASGVVIRNIGFDGQKSLQPADGFSDSFNTGANSTGRAYRALIRAYNSGAEIVGLTVEDCRLVNAYGAGIAAQNVSHAKIRRNLGNGNNFETVELYSTTAVGGATYYAGSEVTDNDITNTGSGDASINGNAIVLNHASEFVVAHNTAKNIERNGLKCEGCKNGVIRGNVFDTITLGNFGGMQLQQDASNIVVDSNKISNAGNGITNGTVSGGTGYFNLVFVNNIIDTTTGPSQGDGISFAFPTTPVSSGITIAHNQMRGIQRIGVLIASGPWSNVVIDSNNIKTTSGGANGQYCMNISADTAGTQGLTVTNNLCDLSSAVSSGAGMTFSQISAQTIARAVIVGNTVINQAGRTAITDNNVALFTSGVFGGNHTDGFIRMGSTGLQAIAPSGAGFSAGYQFAGFQPTAVTFANIGTPANGTILFCSDCTIANPCAGAGTGAIAKRLNGVWVCN